MTAFLSRARPGCASPRAPSTAAERALARFHPRRRPAAERLAARDPRLADLAVTFPGLLATLSAPERGFDPEPAIRLVVQGAPLKAAAVEAGAALWARRLPPEAFAAVSARGLPDGELFRRRIANALPRRARRAAAWLETLSQSARWGDDVFALWAAREAAAAPQPLSEAALRLLALHAFYSNAPETRAGALATRPWRAEAGRSVALDNARAWRTAVELHAHLAGVAIEPWLPPERVGDLDFTPLRSEAEIAEEAAAMGNCLRSLGPHVRRGAQNLWSVRRGGERVATMSLGWAPRSPVVGVREMKGPRNAPVDKAVWAAAQRWAVGHDAALLDPGFVGWRCEVIARAPWTALWRPYWLARRRIPDWLPLAPSREALDALDV